MTQQKKFEDLTIDEILEMIEAEEAEQQIEAERKANRAKRPQRRAQKKQQKQARKLEAPERKHYAGIAAEGYTPIFLHDHGDLHITIDNAEQITRSVKKKIQYHVRRAAADRTAQYKILGSVLGRTRSLHEGFITYDQIMREILAAIERLRLAYGDIDEIKIILVKRKERKEEFEGAAATQVFDDDFNIITVPTPKYPTKENCVLQVLRHTGNKWLPRVYKNVPELDPAITTHTKDGNIYLKKEHLQPVAKAADINIAIKTPLGAALGLVWEYAEGRKKSQDGKVHATKFSVEVRNKHAMLIPSEIKVTKVEYHDPNTPLIPPHDSPALIEYRPTDDKAPKKDVEFYTIFENNHATIHKKYRPSTKTNDPNDDKNPLYFRCLSDASLLSIQLKYENDIYPTPPQFVPIIKRAEKFGTKGTTADYRRLLQKNTPIYECDQNKAYLSYKFDENSNPNPYYMGFPTHNLVAISGEPITTGTIKPVFVEVAIIKMPSHVALAWNTLTANNDASVLTYPLYRFLIDNGATITVSKTIYATTTDIDVVEFAKKRGYDLSTDKRSILETIGRLIIGGMEGASEQTYTNIGRNELEQMKFECDSNNIKYIYEPKCPDNSTKPSHYTFRAFIPHRKPKGAFHVHAFVLSYALIAILKKFMHLKNLNANIVAWNTDAIYYAAPNILTPDNPNLGGFKTTLLCPKNPQKAYLKALTPTTPADIFDQTYAPLQFSTLPHSIKPNQFTILTGSGGIGKSYPFITNPLPGMIMLTPTLVLRSKQQQQLNNRAPAMTVQRYFALGCTDARAEIVRRRFGRYSVVVIDEYTLLNRRQWETVIRRAKQDGCILIVLGDPEQVHNSMDLIADEEGDEQNEVQVADENNDKSQQVSLPFFAKHGFIEHELKRNENTPCRHEFTYGKQLDSFRGLSPLSQTQKTKNIFKHANAPTLDDPFFYFRNNTRMVVGNHISAHTHNTLAKEMIEHLNEGRPASEHILFPFRRVNKSESRGEIVYLPTTTPNVFWNRKKVSDIPPKGTHYEPAWACTSDCLQGQTFETEFILIHTESCSRRHGVIYTAITRARRPEQVYWL